jgi:hypothetical protein
MASTREQAATAPLPEPVEDWSHDEFSEYASPNLAAGNVAWRLLTHSMDHAGDLGRVIGSPAPDGLESEDMIAFTYDVITAAASIGYLVAKVDVAAFEAPTHGVIGKVRIADMARAVAVLARMPLVEDRADR